MINGGTLSILRSHQNAFLCGPLLSPWRPGFEHQMESIDNRHSQTVWENWRVLKAPELGILFWAGGGLKGGMETVTLSTKFIIFFLCSQQKIKKTYTPCKTKALGPVLLQPERYELQGIIMDHPGGHWWWPLAGGLVVFESKKSDRRKAPHLRVRPHRCIPLGDHPVRGPAWDPTRAAWRSWRSHSRGGWRYGPRNLPCFWLGRYQLLVEVWEHVIWPVCTWMLVLICARGLISQSLLSLGPKLLEFGHGWFLGTPHSWATATIIFCFKTIAHGHVPTRRNNNKKSGGV